MENANERVYFLRKTLELSMEKFGNKIGMTKGAVNNLEKGVNPVSNQTAKLICSEFNVNYDWLINGVGNMFSDVPETFLDEVIKEYNIGDENKPLLKAYVEATEEQRIQILEFIKSVIKNIESENKNGKL